MFKTFFLIFLFVNLQIISQDELIQNISGRKTVSLNGDWHIIIDPYENGYYNYRYEPNPNGYFKNQKPKDKSDLVEYDFDLSPTLKVPGDWNSQRTDLFFYEGTIWYKNCFNYILPENKKLFLHFGGVNYEAKVYFNGHYLGTHIGGFTPFNFEITDLVKVKDNIVVLKVDNTRKREGVPTKNTDWWNYGGLTRDVSLIETPKLFVQDYSIQLNLQDDRQIQFELNLSERISEQLIRISIPEIKLDTLVGTNSLGKVAFSFQCELELWSPENPKLYDVLIEYNDEIIKDRIGFRTISTSGYDILLNGIPIFLRGISIHEEAPITGGRATNPKHAQILLNWAKELGCNFVRLAHYPHNEHMLKLADELGLMVWSEIPVYWTILWDNDETYKNAANQLTEMITRDKNRASVIIWSVANETPRSESRLKFLRNLIDSARTLDPTRLISAATELTYSGNNNILLDDPLSEYLDVIGANEYLGWYGGKVEDIPNHNWKISFEKPLVISEFGAGALQGYHADKETRWSEEYQEELYIKQLEMFEKVHFLKGMSPWILMDFRSPRRVLPNIQDYWNRKGLVSNKGDKKKAFYILQNYYLGK